MARSHEQIVRHRRPSGWGESVYRDPPAGIRPYVEGRYQGWAESTLLPVRRREVPNGIIPLILNWGAPYRLLDPRAPESATATVGTFVAGLHTSYTLVETTGISIGVQVNLTPIGALLVLRMPLDSLANRVVELENILGGAARQIVDRLQYAPDWKTRFQIVDDFIIARIEDARRPSAAVARAWHRLLQTDGSLSVSELASDVGYSRKHLTAQFRAEFGLPPKTVGRILRFNAAIRSIERDSHLRLGHLAQECGYYDQAHFVRDFTAFAGIPPGEFLRRRVLDGGVIDR